MKGSGRMTVVLLVILMAAGWVCAFLGVMDGRDQEAGIAADYQNYVDQAQDYSRRGLYQKAIEEYEKAVQVKNREEDWEKLLEVYAARWKEDDSIRDQYLEAAKRAVKAYKKNSGFYQILTDLCREKEDYTTACTYLERACRQGVEDPQIQALYKQVLYACELDDKSYTAFCSLCNGYYAVSSQGLWGYLSEDGKQTIKCEYEFLGSVGEGKAFAFTDEETSGILDMDGILQGKFNFTPEEAGIPSEDRIPVKKGKFAYYNLLGDKQFGSYLQAGSFQDGKAAVDTGKGWVLIDPDGNVVSETYEEIRLQPDGAYLKQNVMLAKKDGIWHLYDNKEKQIGDFACDDVDQITEDKQIAFQKDGKWGFADLKGNILIDPVYEEAKSFSQGLAGVYQDGWWGFINEENELVIPASYTAVDYFNKEGSCMVQTREKSWQLLKRYVNQ